jgi:hypothetical protein
MGILRPIANAASGERQKHQPDRHAKADIDHAVRRRRHDGRDVGIAEGRLHEGGIRLGLAQNLIAAGHVARDRQRRQQQSISEKSRLPRRVPAFRAQPIMDADTGMHPHRDERDHLHGAEPGPVQPLTDKNGVVVGRGVEREFGYARADDVKHQQ